MACSTSFVLNAYNFLFLKRFAIYVWFALAPQLWTICPLMGAAWTTKTYHKFKLVVVNAWVDIPEDYEIEARAHEALHEEHQREKSANQRTSSPAMRMWGSVINRKEKGNAREKDSGQGNLREGERVLEAKNGVSSKTRNGSVR